MLDKAIAQPIYGDSRARWRQGSEYYDSDGKLLTPEEAAMPGEQPPQDEKPVYPPGVTATYSAPKNEAKPKPPTAPVLVVGKLKDPPKPQDRRARLAAMNNTRLVKLVRAAGGDPITGPGSNSANIEWLLTHTEE